MYLSMIFSFYLFPINFSSSFVLRDAQSGLFVALFALKFNCEAVPPPAWVPGCVGYVFLDDNATSSLNPGVSAVFFVLFPAKCVDFPMM